jgi:hypothetical protein
MDKTLLIKIDNYKAVKDSQGNDVNVCFSFSVPYGIPYEITFAALDEIKADLLEMQTISNKPAEPVAEAVAVEPEAITPEIVS